VRRAIQSLLMRRRLFTYLSALSLLLCVATVILWVRTHRKVDSFKFSLGGQKWRAASMDGRLFIDNSPEVADEPDELTKWRIEYTAALETATRQRDWDLDKFRAFDASFHAIKPPGKEELKPLDIGHGWAVTILAGLPAMWGLATCLRFQRYHRRLRRAAYGFCWSCGYDLHATPDCCPECGAVPYAKARMI
jgi:hypothetical protein